MGLDRADGGDAGDAAAFVWDVARRRIAGADDAACRLFGEIDARELAQRRFGPDDPLARALALGGPLDLLIATPSGFRVHAAQTAPVTLPDGRPGVGVRIALPGRAPHDGDRAAAMLDTAPAALLCADAGGRILAANAEASALLGAPSHLQNLFGPEAAGLIGQTLATGAGGMRLSAAGRDLRLTLLRAADPLRAAPMLVAWLTEAEPRDDAASAPAAEAHAPVPHAAAAGAPEGLLLHESGALLGADEATATRFGFADAGALRAEARLADLFPDDAHRFVPGETVAAAAALPGGGSLPVRVRTVRLGDSGRPLTALFLRFPGDGPSEEAGDAGAHPSLVIGAPPAPARETPAAPAVPDAAREALLVTDGAGAILHANAAARALLASGAALEGQSFAPFVAPDYRADVSDLVSGLSEGGLGRAFAAGREIALTDAAGRTFAADVRLLAAGQGAERRVAAAIADASHRQALADEARARVEAAEREARQKSDFLARMSHELRTPLNAIIGFSDLIAEERFGPIGNARYASYIGDIRTSAGLLLSLVNDLLDLSKIEAGKLTVRFEAVPLRDLVDECMAVVRPQAMAAKLALKTELDADLPAVVADARALRQILVNLLSNAIKFTRPGGTVTAAAGVTADGGLVLAVRDTGVGMTPAQVRHAMEPYAQVETELGAQAQGTGLGLPIAKALTEANKAEFRVTSAPGAGTSAEVVFPPTQVLVE